MRDEKQNIVTKDNSIIVKGKKLIPIHDAGIRVPNSLRRSYSINYSSFALLSRVKIQELMLTKKYGSIKALQEIDTHFHFK